MVHERQEPGRQPVPEEAPEPAVGGRDAEQEVRRLEQLLAHRAALGAVGVEEGVGLLAAEDVGELPAQVGGILDCVCFAVSTSLRRLTLTWWELTAGIHALSSGRGVDVRRVPSQELSALPVTAGHAMMEPEPRHPEGVVAAAVLLFMLRPNRRPKNRSTAIRSCRRCKSSTLSARPSCCQA